MEGVPDTPTVILRLDERAQRLAKKVSDDRVQSYQTYDPEISLRASHCELAAAMWMNKFWYALREGTSSIGPNVGDDVQVRGTKNAMRLMVFKGDSDTDRFILAGWSRENPATVYLKGWIVGAKAKDETFWREGSDRTFECYMVPVVNLQPMHTIAR